MNYRKITLEAVVHQDEAEVFVQALNDKLDALEGSVTVYSSSIREEEAGEPENAAEIAEREEREA